MRLRYGTINADYAGVLAATAPDRDGPIWMVNFMRYRPVADYADGRQSDMSGQEADDLYAPLDVLAAIGAELVFAANVVGEGTEAWHRIGIVRYPTRRSFIEMQARPDFQERHIHKDAGMEFTIVMGALPSAGSGDAGRGAPVRLIAYAAGHPAPPPRAATTRFDVEGVIIGDERRFGQLDITWGPSGQASAPDGGLIALTDPFLDRIAELLPQT